VASLNVSIATIVRFSVKFPEAPAAKPAHPLTTMLKPDRII
jgi:hypothetical protein